MRQDDESQPLPAASLPAWWDLSMMQRFWFALGVDAMDPDANPEDTYVRYLRRLAS